MNEHNIKLIPWEIAAYLEGRITQLRRPIEPQPPGEIQQKGPLRWWAKIPSSEKGKYSIAELTPEYQPGDTITGLGTITRVWVERINEIATGDVAECGVPFNEDAEDTGDPWANWHEYVEAPFIKQWDADYSNPELPLDQEDPMLYESGPWVWAHEFERTK